MKVGIQINTLEVNVQRPLTDEQINIIKKLREDGHQIVILLNMKEYQEELACLNKTATVIEDVIKTFLDASGVEYEEIIITTDSQRDISVKNGINYLVRDKLNEEVYQSISKLTGYPSIDKPWLQHYGDVDEQLIKNADCKIYEYLYRNNRMNQNEIVISYFGLDISYQEMFDKIDQYARTLISYGAKKGDTISICLPNVPEVIYYIYACNRIGVTPYLIDPRSNPNRIKECAKLSDSKILVAIIDVFDKLYSSIDEKDFQRVILVSPMDALAKSNRIKFILPKQHYEKTKTEIRKKINKDSQTLYSFNDEIHDLVVSNGDFIDTEYDNNVPAAIVNTSGTTGTPKGALLTNQGFNSSVYYTRIVAPTIHRGQTYLGCIPVFSMYGAIVGFHTAACTGIKTFLVPKFNPYKYDKLYSEFSPSISIGVPKTFKTFVGSKYSKRTKFENAVLMIMGGDKIFGKQLFDINDSIVKNGSRVKISYGYGLTEAGPIAFSPTKYEHYIEGSAGFIRPEVNCKIIGNGSELEYNKSGEICVCSPTMMSGYLSNPSETDNISYIDEFGTKFYRSGDKGYITPEGELIIQGRFKRLIKRPDGHQVNCEEIERQLIKHFLIKNCVVVGVKSKDQTEGEIPTAFLDIPTLNQQNRKEILEDILQFCRENMSGEREMPLAFVVDCAIPYTENGKVDFVYLSKLFLEDINPFLVNDPIYNGYFDKKFKKVFI